MATATVPAEVSDDLIELLGSAEAVAVEMHRALVLDLLREGRISQGRAALLLGIDRWEPLELMGRLCIPSGPLTPEEAERDVEAAYQARRER